MKNKYIHMKYEMILAVFNKYNRNGHISDRRYYINFLRNMAFTYQD